MVMEMAWDGAAKREDEWDVGSDPRIDLWMARLSSLMLEKCTFELLGGTLVDILKVHFHISDRRYASVCTCRINV